MNSRSFETSYLFSHAFKIRKEKEKSRKISESSIPLTINKVYSLQTRSVKSYTVVFQQLI